MEIDRRLIDGEEELSLQEDGFSSAEEFFLGIDCFLDLKVHRRSIPLEQSKYEYVVLLQTNSHVDEVYVKSTADLFKLLRELSPVMQVAIESWKHRNS